MTMIYMITILDDYKKLDCLLKYISKEKYDKLKRYRKKEDYQRSLLGEVMVRSLLIKYYGLDHKQINILIDKYGKPYIGGSNINFNMAHSGDRIICAITDKSSIGIDIEEIKSIDDGVAKHFMTDKEYLRMQNYYGPDKLKYLYQIWTIKESYIKADGRGMQIPLEDIDICIDDGEIQLSHNCEESNYHIRNLIDGDYSISVCSQRRYGDIEIKTIDFNDITNILR